MVVFMSFECDAVRHAFSSASAAECSFALREAVAESGLGLLRPRLLVVA